MFDKAPRSVGMPHLDFPAWAAAEFLDLSVADGVVLRKLVCRLGADRWQWSISAISPPDRGELISSGTAETIVKARIGARRTRKMLAPRPDTSSRPHPATAPHGRREHFLPNRA